MDRARVLIKTPWRPVIQHTVNVHIQGEVYRVHVVEECRNSSDTCQCRRRSAFGSLEELESDESDVGTPLNERICGLEKEDDSQYMEVPGNLDAPTRTTPTSTPRVKLHELATLPSGSKGNANPNSKDNTCWVQVPKQTQGRPDYTSDTHEDQTARHRSVSADREDHTQSRQRGISYCTKMETVEVEGVVVCRGDKF